MSAVVRKPTSLIKVPRGTEKSLSQNPDLNLNMWKLHPPEFFDNKFKQIGLNFPNPDCQPHFHQKVCIYAIARYRNVNLLVSLGMGKSSISLHAIKALKLRGVIKGSSLILVPTLLLADELTKEVHKQRPDFSCLNLAKIAPSKRWEKLTKDSSDVVVLNYQGLTALLGMFNSKSTKYKKHRMLNESRVKQFMSKFDAVVMDEITAVKNSNSFIFKACAQFQRFCPVRIGMTGTPFGKNMEDLWGEFFVVDGGKALGTSEYQFYNDFFLSSPNFWGGIDRKFIKKKLPLLKQGLYKSSIYYEQGECYDLPELIEQDVMISMSPKTRVFYDELRHKVKSLVSSGVDEIATLGSLWIKSRQICSGFVNQPINGGMVCLDIPDNAKLEKLKELVNSVPEDNQFIVFTSFVHSNDLVMQMLEKEDIPCGKISGATSATDREIIMNEFKTGKLKGIVLNTQIGALGLNLQNANYCFFYDLPVSTITYKQAKARVHRTGQTNTTFIYSFCTNDSVEETILDALKKGQELHNKVFHTSSDLLEHIK